MDIATASPASRARRNLTHRLSSNDLQMGNVLPRRGADAAQNESSKENSREPVEIPETCLFTYLWCAVVMGEETEKSQRAQRSVWDENRTIEEGAKTEPVS